MGVAPLDGQPGAGVVDPEVADARGRQDQGEILPPHRRVADHAHRAVERIDVGGGVRVGAGGIERGVAGTVDRESERDVAGVLGVLTGGPGVGMGKTDLNPGAVRHQVEGQAAQHEALAGHTGGRGHGERSGDALGRDIHRAAAAGKRVGRARDVHPGAARGPDVAEAQQVELRPRGRHGRGDHLVDPPGVGVDQLGVAPLDGEAATGVVDPQGAAARGRQDQGEVIPPQRGVGQCADRPVELVHVAGR